MMRFLRTRNGQSFNFNVYLLPCGGPCNAGYIFLDLDHARPPGCSRNHGEKWS